MREVFSPHPHPHPQPQQAPGSGLGSPRGGEAAGLLREACHPGGGWWCAVTTDRYILPVYT